MYGVCVFPPAVGGSVVMIVTCACLHTQALAKLPQPPSTVAVLPHNKAHNRFNNIFPCETPFMHLTICQHFGLHKRNMFVVIFLR